MQAWNCPGRPENRPVREQTGTTQGHLLILVRLSAPSTMPEFILETAEGFSRRLREPEKSGCLRMEWTEKTFRESPTFWRVADVWNYLLFLAETIINVYEKRNKYSDMKKILAMMEEELKEACGLPRKICQSSVVKPSGFVRIPVPANGSSQGL